jgi:PleD family two-component response regulator
VTVSLGETVDPKALVERADVLLYLAKLAGRNRFLADEKSRAVAES